MGLFKSSSEYSVLRPSKKIVVAGASAGCGVSFISELLAFGLSKLGSVSVSELGTGKFYDEFGFESRFLVRGFEDYFEKIQNGERIDYGKCSKNCFENINWICKKSDKNPSLSAAELFRCFYLPNEEYCIFDCSGLDTDSVSALLAEADVPVVVINPLPSSLEKGRTFLQNIRIKLPDALMVVNRMNSGVYISELNRFLSTKTYFSVPSVPDDLIYKAEYKKESFCKQNQVVRIIEKPQDMLCRVFQ